VQDRRDTGSFSSSIRTGSLARRPRRWSLQ
jgi:hypothetical protein